MPHLDYELLKIPSRLRALSRPFGLLMALLLVGFLGLTDYLTGSELSFSIFYRELGSKGV
ncbi:MAG: hypothetical protein EXR91_11445 [Gemmatimonadetes bacterium]|nr:hypothetical protein [Gemmatimonadota bacterium]